MQITYYDYVTPYSGSIEIYEETTIGFTSRMDIDCPGDRDVFSCNISSSYGGLSLEWRVTLPGHEPISHTFDGNSALQTIIHLDMGLEVIQYDHIIGQNGSANGELQLVHLVNVSENGTQIECRENDVGLTATFTLITNTAGIQNHHKHS